MTSPPPLRLPFRPRKLLLFSGHMIDAPHRRTPRFPAAVAPAAQRRIDDVLDDLDAGAGDIGLTQGAAGGDLLFAEACVRRGVPLQLLLPLPEPDFIAASVLPSADGERWKERYFAVKAALRWPPQEMPAAEGDPFEACNEWLLSTAVHSGAAELHFICLWNGSGGDGPGGTAHMVREVQQLNGRVTWIDTRTLQP
ncbi:hypothetical protein [Piscinibacter sp.]|uniref:hypothetical protein n=1 Tax=Piscinibacter sp. TaxID=1903157 RepID=UPI002CAB9787|nr:hypothetical protein [Albitalea sp.]HUG25866.1 hypothetical protein [Albitalea sp.]